MIGKRKDTFRNFVEEYVNKVKVIDQTIPEQKKQNEKDEIIEKEMLTRI